VNGLSQAIVGGTTQSWQLGDSSVAGVTYYNSVYTPLYYFNSSQVVRSDDVYGTNLIAYGGPGGPNGNMSGESGMAIDSQGRIYVADQYNSRIVRFDDMNGTNWTTYGSYGSGTPGLFQSPAAISVDAAGHIYVADAGQVVRIDDMNGTNWTTLPGYGIPAFDSSGRLYFTDAVNGGIVRMDDFTGTNLVALATPGAQGVTVDGAGKIYVLGVTNVLGTTVVRFDDMTGANPVSITIPTTNPHSITVDPNGMVLVGGGGAFLIDGMTGVTQSGGSLTNYIYGAGSYYVWGSTLLPLPTPRPAAISFNPQTLSFSQNVGTTSPPQTITVTNFGGSPIANLTVSASGVFGETTNCPFVLPGGSSCTISVTYTPTAATNDVGAISFLDNSYNLGASQSIVVTGIGTTPAATLSATTLGFNSQVVGTTSNARSITINSSGTGPLQIANVAVSGPFAQTNTCASAIAPGANCSVSVTFSPTVIGNATGTLTITDNAGTQTVTITGSGSAPVSFSSSSINFGSVATGSTSIARTVTATNRLSTSITITGVAVTGSFSIASNTCGTSLAPGTSCTVGVTFSPTTVAAANGTLTFTDSAATSPQTVALSGTGTAPVTFSSSSISFGTVKIGTTSSTRTVTLTNRLSVALSITSVVASTGFNVANNTCATSVAAGASCSISVTFSPTALGAATGALTVTDSALTSPQAVNLSGIGGTSGGGGGGND
jgi:sugar lactone lactonase YvrE